MDATHAHITVNDISYGVATGGPADAPVTLLCIHAFPLSHFLWESQWNVLNKSVRLIAPDTRGFGATPWGDGAFFLEDAVDDMVGLLDHFGVEQAVVMGCSMGGYITLRMAERHPDRVRGIVLVDTRPASDTEAARLNRYDVKKKLLADGHLDFVEMMIPKLLGTTTRQTRPDIVARVREMALGASIEGIGAALVAMATRTDTTEALARMTMPALVVHGEEDDLIPIADAVATSQQLPNARLLRVPKAGHLAGMEQPEIVNASLRAFLDSLL